LGCAIGELSVRSLKLRQNDVRLKAASRWRTVPSHLRGAPRCVVGYCWCCCRVSSRVGAMCGFAVGKVVVGGRGWEGRSRRSWLHSELEIICARPNAATRKITCKCAPMASGPLRARRASLARRPQRSSYCRVCLLCRHRRGW
jgi:hypothetical protein